MTSWQKSLSAAFLALPLCASADVQVHGFLNAVGGFATERPNSRYGQEELRFEPDSSFGLQVSSEISEKTSVTGQLVARGANDFRAEAAWAYMTHRTSDTSRFRAGRFRTPFFFYSEHLDVGYSQHWLSPPGEVYALQFDSINGVDFSHTFPVGPLDANIQVYAGSANNDFVNSKTGHTMALELREQVGLVGTLDYQWLTLRASFHQVSNLTVTNFSELTLPMPLGNIAGLRDAIASVNQQLELGPNGQYILDNLDMVNVAGEFSEAAAKLEWEHFFVVAEGTLLTFDQGPLAEQRRHFISGGTHLGKLALYATYARANDKQVPLAAFLPIIVGVTDGLNVALDALTSSLMLQSKTSSVGLRYDFEPGAAFKLEISQNRVPDATDSYMARFGYNLIF